MFIAGHSKTIRWNPKYLVDLYSSTCTETRSSRI